MQVHSTLLLKVFKCKLVCRKCKWSFKMFIACTRCCWVVYDLVAVQWPQIQHMKKASIDSSCWRKIPIETTDYPQVIDRINPSKPNSEGHKKFLVIHNQRGLIHFYLFDYFLTTTPIKIRLINRSHKLSNSIRIFSTSQQLCCIRLSQHRHEVVRHWHCAVETDRNWRRRRRHVRNVKQSSQVLLLDRPFMTCHRYFVVWVWFIFSINAIID